MRKTAIKIQEIIILEGKSYGEQIAHEEQIALMNIQMNDLKHRLARTEIGLATIANPCPEGMVLHESGTCVRPNYLEKRLE